MLCYSALFGGWQVLEVIEAMRQASGKPIPIEVGPAR